MKCEYCSVSTARHLAICQACNLHFCNQQDIVDTNCHILQHIKDTKHHSFSFPIRGVPQCKECGRKNIITLYKDTDSSVYCNLHKNDECVPIVQYKKVQFLISQPVQKQTPPYTTYCSISELVEQIKSFSLSQVTSSANDEYSEIFLTEKPSHKVPSNSQKDQEHLKTVDTLIDDMQTKILEFKDLTQSELLRNGKLKLDEVESMLEKAQQVLESTTSSRQKIDMYSRINSLKPILLQCHIKQDPAYEYKKSLQEQDQQAG